MKKLILLLCLVINIAVANAQIVEKGEGNPIWGVRAAFDVNLPGKVRSNVFNDKMFRTGTGGTLGAVCNIYLGSKFYLEPAISLFYDTYSYNDIVIADDYYMEDDPTVYKVGIRIPVIVGYSIGVSDLISIAPFTGPELSYAFAGDIRFHNIDKMDLEDVSFLSLFGKNGNQHRLECGWKIGVAFFSGKWSFNIDGTIGMTNLMKNGLKFHENRGSVSITRYF